jgi:hypothetical protein
MTLEEIREHERRAYWASSLYLVEEASRSLVNGVEVPVVGQDLDLALTYSIEAAGRMSKLDNPVERWAHDVAFFLGGRLLAVLRMSPNGPLVTKFDSTTRPSIESERADCRAARKPTINWVDGSYESTGYGASIPLDGRNLVDVLGTSIESVCENMRNPNPEFRETDDVVATFRGRILAAIRVSPDGPVVHRFEPITG